MVLGVVVRDLGEWRPGFYTEFRRESREHSGLAWGAIFEKVIQNKEIHTFLKMVCPKNQDIVIFQELIMDLEVHIWTFLQQIWTLRSNNRL